MVLIALWRPIRRLRISEFPANRIISEKSLLTIWLESSNAPLKGWT